MAEDQGEHAIGIILSGTGSDGALGMRAIKAHGGFTVVQDPATAKYNGMPLAALDTKLVDLVLPPDRIGSHIAEIVQFPAKAYQLMKEMDNGMIAWDEVLAAVKRRTEVDFSRYKPATIGRRIERRTAANSIHDIQDYLMFMRENPVEADALCKGILISVTQFFRDTDAFQKLGEALDVILQRKVPGEEVRIWTPGCATGEEPYTLAIMLAERLGIRLGNYKVPIFATDVDLEALTRAR